jgi:hypothetical protein
VALANRKQLADTTKDFKRSTDSSGAQRAAAVDGSRPPLPRPALTHPPSTACLLGAGGMASSKAVGTLLKRYQEEIDNLTKRAKHSEAAFLDMYQQLYEVSR